MSENKSIEEELDNILKSLDNEINKTNYKFQSLKSIEKDILDVNKQEMNSNIQTITQFKNDLIYTININESLNYLKFYQDLDQIKKEKEYYTKLDLINKIVLIIRNNNLFIEYRFTGFKKMSNY